MIHVAEGCILNGIVNRKSTPTKATVHNTRTPAKCQGTCKVPLGQCAAAELSTISRKMPFDTTLSLSIPVRHPDDKITETTTQELDRVQARQALSAEVLGSI